MFSSKNKTSNPTFPQLPINIREESVAPQVLELMPRKLVQDLRAFVFDNKGTVKIAALSPANLALRRFALECFGSEVEWYQATQKDLDFVLAQYARDFKSEILKLAGGDITHNGNNSEIVNTIIEYALRRRSSDIHIEPTRAATEVRFRVDGILQKAVELPRAIHSAIVARLKILANLKIDEYRLPQDGRIELVEFPDISLRISTIPTIYGEKVALRILDETSKDLSLKQLGFTEAQAEILLKNIEKPFGMIVTSGPTGSGKTTTLYGLLSLLKKERMNISTLEDPVEYALAGINQIHINPRVQLTFASGLRALLRQDPDAIMVGEIRDSETAVMAANAALTGHLVLTTMHTNDAPSVFTRLLEMKVEDFTVASIVNLALAQRLVRKICINCKMEKPLDDVIRRRVLSRPDVLLALKHIGEDGRALQNRMFAYGAGCDSCLMTGYSGRVGMFELLELTEEMHDLILDHAPAEKIKTAAIKNGFQDMMVDGLQKVLTGTTTIDEVLRATRSA